MFKVALCIYKVFNGGTSFVFGYSFFSGKSSSRRISKIDFQNCAHVARVLFRRRMFELEGPKLRHFILRYLHLICDCDYSIED